MLCSYPMQIMLCTASASLWLILIALVTHQTRAITEISFYIVENSGNDYRVGRLEEQGNNYRFSTNNAICKDYFNIVNTSGEIFTKKNVDRETVISQSEDGDIISCLVNYNNGETTNTLQVKFHILDVNDFVPYISGLTRPVGNLSVYENLNPGQIITYIVPVDLDAGPNGTVSVQITNGNDEGFFRLGPPEKDTNDRFFYLNKSVNYETHHYFNLTLELHDHGNPPLSATQYIVINITDLNDEAPTFPQREFIFNITEDHSVGSANPIGSLDAIDDDSTTHSQIFYQIIEDGSIDTTALDYFAVNATTGEVYLIQSLDYERDTQHEYSFKVEARNPGKPYGNDATVKVIVLDANDAPVITLYNPVLYENENNFTFFFHFQDTDSQPPNNLHNNTTILFDPPISHGPVRITTISEGNVFVSVTVTQPLDREQYQVLFIRVTSKDNGKPPLSTTRNFTISIWDINDNAPQFTENKYYGRIAASSKPTKSVLKVSASDPDNGCNGTFNFSLISVSPSEAQTWFNIDAQTGVINLISDPNYKLVNGSIKLQISATDNGNDSLTNTTSVDIFISPPVTFQPISFQQYNGYNLLTSNLIYLEFKTGEKDALLLYQYTDSNFISIEIVNSHVVCSTDSHQTTNNVTLVVNKWYSLLLDKSGGNMATLSVWDRESLNNPQALQILQTAGLEECSSSQSSPQLYLGGVKDTFTIPNGQLKSTDFLGSIGTLVIDGHQLDLTCPDDSRNTIMGSHLLPNCYYNQCNEHSYCVEYTDTNGLCQCNTGFPPDTCNEHSDFDPISLTNNSFIDFTLDYNFFYSHANTPNITQDNIIQTITMSFVPTTNDLVGLLFYSKTDESIHRVEIEETLRYTLTDTNYGLLFSLVSEKITLIAETEYELSLQITSNEPGGVMKIYQKGQPQAKLKVNSNNFGNTFQPKLFAKQPSTLVSIGGTQDTKAKFVTRGSFSGCVTSFTIDGIAIPLIGLKQTGAQNFNVRGYSDTCHLCDYSSTCPSNSTCNKGIPKSTYTCTCNIGYVMNGNTCVRDNRIQATITVSATPAVTAPPNIDDVEEPTEAVKLYFIIMIGGSGVLLISLTLIILAISFRCAYARGRKKRRPQFVTQITYHAGGSNIAIDDIKNDRDGLPQSTSHKSNHYIQTSLMNGLRSVRASSDDMDGDSVLDGYNSPCSYRKSTSQETGFQTASEHDGPSTRSSPRRVSDSGKDSEQYDSDLTSFETDSEDLTTSGIEEVLSPNDVRLVSSGSMMGVPTSYRRKHQLSPQEKMALTPLRPNSSMLLSEDETDTEVSTTTNTTNNHRRRYSDNESYVSEARGPKWYKSSSPSTVVDSETNVPYGTKAAVLHKKNREKTKPPSLPHLKQHKSASPIQQLSPYALNHTHNPVPLSSSPLVQSHRFDYPPPTHNSHYVNHIDQVRLPAIAETLPLQYPPYHHPTYNPRQHSDHHTMGGPSHLHGPADPPYYIGYQGTHLTPGGGAHDGTTYRDLNSFAKVNPITYWEQQQRLRPTVDQDDPLHFLTEPYRKFEDVSTTPSVAESTVIDSEDKESFIVPSAIKRPHTSRGVHRNDYVNMPRKLPPHPYINVSAIHSSSSSSRELNSEGEDDKEQISYILIADELPDEVITHFPSADCTPTLMSPASNPLVSSTSTLADDTPHSSGGFRANSSQEPLNV